MWVFYVDTISVAIPEQVCCVCAMRLYQLFSALFALKFNGWSCIFKHLIQLHFGTRWVVTYRSFLTLQSLRFKFWVACATHCVCLGDSLPVLRQSWLLLLLFVFVFSLFTIFCQILFDFIFTILLSFFIQYFRFWYSCTFKYFIIIVCLFITFLQALVHWCAYESCFLVLVQASTISLA